MLDRLSDVVEKAELAVGSSSGVVLDDELEPLIDLLKTIRVRMSYPDDVLIVALAGGTGSGKSSLFNALAGEDLVDVGGIRPTTSRPAVAVPHAIGSGLDGLLDRLGIDERYSYDGPRLCLIDLPDTDSVEVEHHLQVDRVVPYVDAVVWVTDPEKYRDARLHHDYLAPLAGYANQFVVVLNQIDRLDPSQLAEVTTDLESALADEGLAGAVVLSVAAAPPAGPPEGLEALVDKLERMRVSRSAVSRKLLTDLGTTASRLAAGAGDSVDFDDRARLAVERAAAGIGDNDSATAVGILTAFLDDIGAEVGGPTAETLARVAADVPGHVTRISAELGRAHGRRWFRREREFDLDDAVARLNEAVIRPARAALAKRAVALASIADLAVEVEALADLPRL